jgi:hypothetical protein
LKNLDLKMEYFFLSLSLFWFDISSQLVYV